MNLIHKCLSMLPENSRIHVSYGHVKDQTLMVSGTVIDNDHSTCLALRDDSGRILLLNYTTVQSLLSEEPAAQQPGSADRTPKKTVLHERMPERQIISASDRELKDLFDGLSREEKKLLQKAWDSFCYGVRTTSPEKIQAAGETARRTVWKEHDAGRDWSADAFRLAALLLCRAGISDGELFSFADCWQEAALCDMKNRDDLSAGINAAQALLEGSGGREDMLIILARSCVALDDASALSRLHAAGVDVAEAAEDLLSYKKAAPCASLEESLRLLEKLYPSQGIGWALDEDEAAPEQPEEPITGSITRLLWVNQTGTITYTADGETRTVPFDYSGIRDAGLRSRLAQPSSNLSDADRPVRFILRDGKAVDIEKAPSLLKLAQTAVQEGSLEDLLLLCDQADGTRMFPAVLALAVEALGAAGQADTGVVTQCRLLEERYRLRWDELPNTGRSLSQLAQLYHSLRDHSQCLALTEQALEDKAMSHKLRATVLCQSMRYRASAFNETGDESLLHGIRDLADQWLELYSGPLAGDPSCAKYHCRVLKWKLRSLCVQDQVEEARVIYAALTRQYPADSKLSACADQIRQAEQRRKADAEPQPQAVPVHKAQPEEEPAEEAEESFDCGPYHDSDGWQALGMSREDYIAAALAMEGPERLASQLAYLKTGAMLNPELQSVCTTVSHAVNSPLERNVYNTAALVDLLTHADPQYPALNRCCIAASYLRTVFQCENAPVWIRQSIPLVSQIPQLDQVCALLEQFCGDTGHAIDRYAAYRNPDQRARESCRAELLSRAKHLHEVYIATSPRDSAKFARLLQTKKLVYGGLEKLLDCVIRGDWAGLEAAKADYARTFLTDSLEISGEKVDAYIAENWETAGRLLPLSRENVTLQGTRRNALRSGVSAIVSVINDCCRWLENREELPRSQGGQDRFQALAPRLEEALQELIRTCAQLTDCAVSAEEKTGLFLLSYTAGELRDKLTGQWLQGSERYLFRDFLGTGLVPLDDELLPDLTATLCGFGELSLPRRILRHAASPRLEPQAHIDRIFSRERVCQNYDVARQLLRLQEITGGNAALPEHAQRYANQSRLVAKLEMEELRETLAGAGDRQLENTLLYFYDRCCQDGRFGFLTELMDAIRQRLAQAKEEIAA